jgi:hypothetical protein
MGPNKGGCTIESYIFGRLLLKSTILRFEIEWSHNPRRNITQIKISLYFISYEAGRCWNEG